MTIVGAWRLKTNSTASVYNNGTDTSMTYNGSNGVFSGSGYIDIDDGSGVIYGTSAMTAECYFKCTGSGEQFIFAGWEWGSFIIKNTSGNQIDTALYTTGGFTENAIGITSNDGKWHHVALHYTGSNKVTFYDGIQVHSVGQTGTLIDNGYGTPRHLQFGANQGSTHVYSSKLTGGVTEARLHGTSNSSAYYKNRYSYLKGFI